MNQRVPEVVQPLIECYAARLNEYLPGIPHSFYIIGSIALGEFNPQYSDIDFVTVVTRSMTTPEIEALRGIHRDLENSFRRWKMSGSYIQSKDLGRTDEDLGPHLHYHDGILRIQQRNELNAVTWWELKNYGIAVFGIEPQHLAFTVDPTLLRSWMMKNLNSYWESWTRRPTRILMLYSDWGIQWMVTGVLRQFYTFREHAITTKVKAAEYALCYLPVRWHRLIQEAINIREGRRKSAYRFRITRTFEALRFLKFLIYTCNTDYA